MCGDLELCVFVRTKYYNVKLINIKQKKSSNCIMNLVVLIDWSTSQVEL